MKKRNTQWPIVSVPQNRKNTFLFDGDGVIVGMGEKNGQQKLPQTKRSFFCKSKSDSVKKIEKEGQLRLKETSGKKETFRLSSDLTLEGLRLPEKNKEITSLVSNREEDKMRLICFKEMSGRNPGRGRGRGRNPGRGRGRGRGRNPGRGRGRNSDTGGRNNNRDRNRQRTNQRNRYRHNNRNNPPRSPKLPKGVVNVQCTLNNTILTFANLKGKVMGWQSAGTSGFKGARKATAFAAKTAAKSAAQSSIAKGLKRAKVMVKGGGPGRDNALRGLVEAGLEMTLIRDVTGLPHNGCRPKKKRRV